MPIIKKANVLIVISLLLSPIFLGLYQVELPFASAGPTGLVDDCISDLIYKQSPTFANGTWGNVTWNGAQCVAYLNPAYDNVVRDSTGHTAPYVEGSESAASLALINDHPTLDYEQIAFLEYDISWMASFDLNITETRLIIYPNGVNCDFELYNYTFRPTISTAETIFLDGLNGTLYMTNNFEPEPGVQDDAFNAATGQELEFARNSSKTWFAFSITAKNAICNTWNYFNAEEHPMVPDTSPAPTLKVLYDARYTLPPCMPFSADFLNPVAVDDDGYGYAVRKIQYFDFQLVFTNANLSRDKDFSIGFTDGITWHHINYTFGAGINWRYGDFDTQDGGENIRVQQFWPQSVQYVNATWTLTVNFWIFFEDSIQDIKQTIIWGHCSPENGWVDTGEKFNIYSGGGQYDRDTEPGSYFCDDDTLCMCSDTSEISLALTPPKSIIHGGGLNIGASSTLSGSTTPTPAEFRRTNSCKIIVIAALLSVPKNGALPVIGIYDGIGTHGIIKPCNGFGC
jgi:hypothetical protein